MSETADAKAFAYAHAEGYREGYKAGYAVGAVDGRAQGYTDAKARAHSAVYALKDLSTGGEVTAALNAAVGKGRDE